MNVQCILIGQKRDCHMEAIDFYFSSLNPLLHMTFKGRLLYKHQTNNFNNLENWNIYIDKELKILQEKLKLLFSSSDESCSMAGVKCRLCEVMG